MFFNEVLLISSYHTVHLPQLIFMVSSRATLHYALYHVRSLLHATSHLPHPSYHITSYHIKSHHVTSYHITSHSSRIITYTSLTDTSQLIITHTIPPHLTHASSLGDVCRIGRSRVVKTIRVLALQSRISTLFCQKSVRQGKPLHAVYILMSSFNAAAAVSSIE